MSDPIEATEQVAAPTIFLTYTAEVDVDRLAAAIVEQGADVTFALIVALEEHVGEWPFTRRVGDHFANLLEYEPNADADDGVQP